MGYAISPDYRWVSDAAASTVAGAVGVPMIRTQLCRGRKVVTEHPQGPVLLWESLQGRCGPAATLLPLGFKGPQNTLLELSGTLLELFGFLPA
ncbi:MAG: hypothetical protein ACYDC1_02495 [Limisphaerales bacterium]